MLVSDRIQALFGAALHGIYEPAVLETWALSGTRDPATGTFSQTKSGEHDVRAQRDVCTEAQRGQDGYSAEDVRFLILQSGVSAQPNSDSRIIYRGGPYLVMSVDQDPARSYWDCRARLAPS